MDRHWRLQRPMSCLAGFSVLLCCCAGLAAARPLADTSLALSQVVWRPEKTQQYVGSPGIVALPNGSYLASHDDFGSGSFPDTTHVYISDDKGLNWTPAAFIKGQYWSNLFVRPNGPDGEVFLIGTASDGFCAGCDRSVKVSKSLDGGGTWTSAVVLAAPAAGSSYHTSSVPVVLLGGRFYRGVEGWVWPQDFQAMQISAPQDADLQLPTSWTATPPLAFNAAWNNPVLPTLPTAGFLEGNAVVRPDGTVGHLMRMPRLKTGYVDLNHAILFRRDPIKNTLLFDQVVVMPGGGNMFNVRQDPTSLTPLYITLANPQAASANGLDQRNSLQLLVSSDLINWTNVTEVLADDSGMALSPNDSLRFTGFQYVSWQFEGPDLICAIRTAYRTAVNYHNSNRLTFFRVTNWRQYLPALPVGSARIAGQPKPKPVTVATITTPRQPLPGAQRTAAGQIPNVAQVLSGVSPKSGRR